MHTPDKFVCSACLQGLYGLSINDAITGEKEVYEKVILMTLGARKVERTKERSGNGQFLYNSR